MSALSERLRIRRKEQHMTQEELAEIIGYKKQTVSGYERDENEPDYQTLCRIADALSCTADYLLGREEAPTHAAESVMQQTGLSEKAVEVLRNNMLLLKGSPFSTFEYEAVRDFVSALVCSKHLNRISLNYWVWKDAIKEHLNECEQYAEDMSQYFIMDGDFPFSMPKDEYIVKDENGNFVDYSSVFLKKAEEWNKRTRDQHKEIRAIEGARYSIVRTFERFLAENDMLENNYEGSEE